MYKRQGTGGGTLRRAGTGGASPAATLDVSEDVGNGDVGNG